MREIPGGAHALLMEPGCPHQNPRSVRAGGVRPSSRVTEGGLSGTGAAEPRGCALWCSHTSDSGFAKRPSVLVLYPLPQQAWEEGGASVDFSTQRAFALRSIECGKTSVKPAW